VEGRAGREDGCGSTDTGCDGERVEQEAV
jgi:hypothetical protein